MSFGIRFDTVVRFLGVEAERRKITIESRIPEDLASPLMFPAETTAIFGNILSNAIKAAGDGGRTLATGLKHSDGSVRVRIENSGVAVDLKTAEDWFLPYTSTTQTVEPLLGQGMGLGLPITRALLFEYGATVQFVTPSKGYATAVEMRWPKEA